MRITRLSKPTACGRRNRCTGKNIWARSAPRSSLTKRGRLPGFMKKSRLTGTPMRCWKRFLKNEQVLVNLVDAEDVRIAKRPKIVVLHTPVPDNEIVENISERLHPHGQVRV